MANKYKTLLRPDVSDESYCVVMVSRLTERASIVFKGDFEATLFVYELHATEDHGGLYDLAMMPVKLAKATHAEITDSTTTQVLVRNVLVDFDVVVNLMDYELREYVHGLGIEDEQAFVEKYAYLHYLKYGKLFEIN